MRSLLVVALLPLLIQLPQWGGAPVAGAAVPAPGADVVVRAAQEAAALSAVKVWLARHAEFEEFLRTAPIERLEDVGRGVTNPRRAFFPAGGLAVSAIVKDVNEPVTAPRLDSFRSEIAAYELDKLLALDMVPPTVGRQIAGDEHSVQLWVEGCRLFKEVESEAKVDVEGWNRDVHRMRVFDNLIVNIDRNAGNMLVDPRGRLVLIDHSRAFDRAVRMVFPMTKIDRPLLEKLRALDRAALEKQVRRWTPLGIGPILQQRDRIVAHFDKLIAERGEAAVVIR